MSLHYHQANRQRAQASRRGSIKSFSSSSFLCSSAAFFCSGSSRRSSSKSSSTFTRIYHSKKDNEKGTKEVAATLADKQTKEKKQFPFVIKAICSDVDGTLLCSKHKISEKTIATIRMVQEEGIIFLPATGKSRGGVRNALGKEGLGHELTKKGYGGVYLQGLVVYKGDQIIFERTLEPSVSLDVVKFAREKDISIVAFSGERVLCEKLTEPLQALPAQHEPLPDVVSLDDYVKEGNTVHKLILLGPVEQMTLIRPSLQDFVGNRATLTQAQGDMVEVLPPGGSKGDGVSRLLQTLNIDPQHVLAIGDAENDLEMLRLVGLPIAMGNALASVKEVARHIAPTNDDDGAAHAFQQFVLAR